MIVTMHSNGAPYTRDGHEMSMAETETLVFRDADETETLASPAETRPGRDVCRSRDVTKTLKCTLSCSSKQVNVCLTTVATVTACPLISWEDVIFRPWTENSLHWPLLSVLRDGKSGNIGSVGYFPSTDS